LEGFAKQRSIPLHNLVAEPLSEEALCRAVDGVGGVMVLGGLNNKPPAAVGEGDLQQGGTVALLMGDDLDAAISRQRGNRSCRDRCRLRRWSRRDAVAGQSRTPSGLGIRREEGHKDCTKFSFVFYLFFKSKVPSFVLKEVHF
jgi:hypothetical protein